MGIEAEYREHLAIDPDATKWEFVAGEVFGLTTYDGEMDELLVKDIIEVFSAIRSKSSYEYISDRANYIKFVTALNLGNCGSWLDWGTSVRGAWFKDDATAQRFDGVVEFLRFRG
jgi:hypothetical protein